MQTLQILTHYIESVDATEERVDRAASLRFFYKLGYGDSFAAQLALEKGATLVTADPDFAKLGKQLKILALPLHA
jgi:predicted nucleic acid-binding protein